MSVAFARTTRLEHQLDRLVRELAKREFRQRHGAGAGSIYVILPAYNESRNLAAVLARVPKEVEGLPTHTLVVVDGATDDTERVVRELRHQAVSHVVNRGHGAALKAGYEIALEDGAEIVVTLDADGCLSVAFRSPQRAVTPGQSLVLYRGEQCLGGAVIAATDAPLEVSSRPA